MSENIVVKGGTVVEQGDDVLITFTRDKILEDGAGSLSFKAGSASADVLAVGGGGGGGRAPKTTTGGGGGGGGGGFVEVSGLVFKNSYVISVGAGGAGVTGTTITSPTAGGPGGDTTIRQNDLPVSGIADANGGGGGGAGTVGANGGCGGGGSAQSSTSSCNGGTGSQGGNGGRGLHTIVGAGGGGAGGSADDTYTSGGTATTYYKASAGGSGKLSTITGAYYGGGGAGGDARVKNGSLKIDGALGGGGSGGSGTNTDPRDGGKDLGGGGGGGTMAIASGNGGDGVMVIRLSNYVAGGVVVPTIAPLTYDGTEQVAAKDTAYYTITSGDAKGTLAKTYTFTITLTPAGIALGWDNPSDPRISGNSATVTWQILPKPIDKPALTAASFSYTGSPQTGYQTASDYTLNDQNTQTDAGTYTVTATLADAANTQWADLTGAAAQAPRSDLTWTIAKKKITKPSKVDVSIFYPYDGNEHQGYKEDAAWTFSTDGLNLNKATNAAVYTPKATLTDTKNTQWEDWSSATRTDLSWEIRAKEVQKPSPQNFTFDNTEKTCIESTTEYTLANNKQTNAGTYTFTATLNNPEGFVNYKWKNGNAEPYSDTWTIAKRVVTWTEPTKKFPYEKGTVREPVPASDWYTVTGGSAETVGSYHCVVHLLYNTDSQVNVTWNDGTTADKAFDWEITAQQVDRPTVQDYVYDENPKGTAVSRTVLTIAADAPYEKVSGDELTQSTVGDYEFTLKLKDPQNTVWKTDPTTSDPQDFAWSIKKANNEIYGLQLQDWQYGDTTPRAPSCTDVKFGNKSSVKYAWSTSAKGPDWTAWDNKTRPTEAGTYYLRASTPEAQNWNATNVVKRFCIWTNPSEVFTDCMDISIDGVTPRSGDDTYTTVLVKLREPVGGSGAITAGYPGFEYARTGTQASEIRFVLTNAVKLAEQLLPFTNVVWNISGESKLLVRVPKATGQVKTIRMYWHTTDGDPKSDNYPEDVGAAGGFAASQASLVNREGTWIDYWTALPSITKTIWQVDEPPTWDDVSNGSLKEGSISRVVLTMPRGVTNETAELPTAPGTYVIIFDRRPVTGEPETLLYGGEKRLQYDVVWHNTYENLGGTAGGRILLGNNDTMPGHEITGQAYWQTDPAGGTYWVHEGAVSVSSYPNLDGYIRHTLYSSSVSGTTVLWRLWDMRIGSTYGRSGTPAKDRNYLPWSATCQSRTSATAEMSSKEVSYLVLRNTTDAALYSSCYSNGIGTVYFDMVNVDTSDEYSQVIVEVATQTSKGDDPTDQNCAQADEPFYWLTHNRQGEDLSEAEDMWLPVKPIVLIKRADSSEFVVDTAQTETELNQGLINPRITTGGGTETFYRICASTNYTKPCRFRIRRKGEISGGADSSNMVLLDNVIVSPPAMSASLEALGVNDVTTGRTGKQTLGQAGALSTAFPAKTDTGVLGRAKVHFTTTPGIVCDTKTFVASARLNYRWRYLNQSFGDWRTIYLDHTEMTGKEGEIIPTVEPIDFTGRTGDIEWYYDMTLHAPAYKYVDYSGCGVEKPVDGYNEEVQSTTNRQVLASTSVRQASGGTDWFVRLREGKSDWEGMTVVIESDDPKAMRMAGEYPMELVDDNMWRAMVIVPTNAEGNCTFHFRATNLHEGGDPDNIAVETKAYGVQKAATVEIPNSGALDETVFNKVTFTIDHAAGYLEFRMSDRYLTYQVGRAEYQDFNCWNDAHTPATHPYFRADSHDTNSVDAASMKTERADFAKWATFLATKDDWLEDFHLTDYSAKDPKWERDVLRPSTETPKAGAWSAQNITFVAERLVSASAADQSEKVGMSGKLLGNGNGALTYLGNSAMPSPQGLEKVELKARLGQTFTFDSFTYAKAAYMDWNYMFFAPVTMSHRSKDDDTQETKDMAVGAAASLIGYYSPETGCYEFRAERLYTNLDGSKNPTVRLSIYKWYVDGFVWACERLCYRDFDAQALWSYECNADGVWNKEADRKFYGMFISFDTTYDASGVEPKSTRIVCGLSDAHKTDHVESWKNFANAGVTGADTAKYCGLTFTDTVDPYGWGSYGVGSKDCPAQFVMPAHTDSESPFVGMIVKENANNKPSKTGQEGGDGNGKYFKGETFRLLGLDQEFIQDRDKLNNRRYWATIPGRCECFTNTASGWNNWIGLRTPTNLVQDLELYLKPQGSSISQWKLAGRQAVSGYGFQKLPAYDMKLTGQWDMELRPGEYQAIDVVVDDVCQYRWQAPDINDPNTIVSDSRSQIFVYSQALVFTNTSAKAQYVRLQPARALATHPISIRSPIMNGLGKFTFSYADADADAEVWVQVATNHVSGNLSGTGHYNDSIVSKELGEQQEVGEWLTIKKYARTAKAGYSLLDESGTAEPVYLGWHNHADRPIRGLFRLFVPPAVVEKAIVAATNATKNAEYGALTVTALACTDEPGISERSWRGWNMRTIGDPSDAEARMNLVDMVIDEVGGHGLVAALNNSWQQVEDNKGNPVDGKSPEYAGRCPTIYSPTMQPLKKDRGVGSVTVKARLYSTDDRPVTDGAGRIVIYGANDSRASSWQVLCTNYVTSSVFSNFTWTAGNKVYTAVKFEVTESAAAGASPAVDRVVLDEIVIGEKVPPTINFLYARPFRQNLFSKEPVLDIMSPAEQPLAGESWGVQTQLSLQQLTDEIDVEKGFEVQLSYFRGEEPWGYEQWKDKVTAVDGIPLLQVGEKTNLIFRSYGEKPESLVSPSAQGGEIVQFMLTVKYWDRGGKSDSMKLSGWQQPSWFYPLDKNAQYGGDLDESKFSAYTVLDTVSPGRAWINEVSWNDGPMAENGGKLPVTNQFIELCVPASVDLSGWYLRLTDPQLNQRVLARLGDTSGGIPSRKAPTVNCTNGYEFLVLKSPSSTIAQADASWYKFDLGDDIRGGTLPYNDPLQFELVRPSGVIEHQFVMDGTNEWSKWSWGSDYDGTNLIRKLNEADLDTFPFIKSPKRFWAQRELSRAGKPATVVSTGVVRGEGGEDTSFWPGGSNTWHEGMAFTPGRLNVGQTIPKDWMILPNGTNSWVYFTAKDRHIRQKVGAETNQVILVVVPQGKTTNVTYEVDNWYEAVITETDKPQTVGGRGVFSHTVTPTGTVEVVATAQPQSDLVGRYGLTADNPYTPSILRWLTEEYGEYNVEDIRLGRFQGLEDTDRIEWLTLNDMYWLDIPPVPETPAERAMNDGTNWWLRAGITKMGVDHIIKRQEGIAAKTYTNKQVEVKMYVTNACTHEVWAPGKLRGLDYSRSDDYTGIWTSVTFKVCGRLDLTTAKEFMPFRTFVFTGDSFTGPLGDATMDPPLAPYSSRIDILDPFQSPIGRNYGWDKHPNTQAYFMWKIDTDFYPYTIEKLKSDSTYKGDSE